ALCHGSAINSVLATEPLWASIPSGSRNASSWQRSIFEEKERVQSSVDSSAATLSAEPGLLAARRTSRRIRLGTVGVAEMSSVLVVVIDWMEKDASPPMSGTPAAGTGDKVEGAPAYPQGLQDRLELDIAALTAQVMGRLEALTLPP